MARKKKTGPRKGASAIQTALRSLATAKAQGATGNLWEAAHRAESQLTLALGRKKASRHRKRVARKKT